MLLRPAIAEVHEFNLENGLKILVKEDHRAPVAVSQIWYKVGSSYEHDGITGISHMLEHMMFKGTEQHPPGEFSRIISANGGRENAFTGLDYTAYFQTLESSRLEISFELEADRMHRLLLQDKEFAKELEVVKEERRLRTEDKPQSFTYEIAMATAFQTSPYRQPIIGWMSDLNSINVNQLRLWYENWYAPNNATLVVVGDVNPEQVYALVKKHFAAIPAVDIASVGQREEVEQFGEKRVKVKRPAKLPYLLMAYKVPALKNSHDTDTSWEPYALEVLVSILDGGNSARLARRLIRGQEVAASASAGYNLTTRLDYTLTLSGTPAQGRSIKELELAFRQEVIDLQSKLVSSSELQRVKTQVISSDIYEKDSVFYQAMVLGLLETNGLSWKLADEYVDRVKAVTAEQIRAVARKYLIDDRLTVAELVPQPLDNQHQVSLSGGTDYVR